MHFRTWATLEKENQKKTSKIKNPPKKFEEIIKKKDHSSPTNTNISQFHNKEIHTKFGGLWFLIPFMKLLKIGNIAASTDLTGSENIPNINFHVLFTALKSVGLKRIGHVQGYKDDLGLGLFSGLTAVPDQSVIHRSLKRFSAKNVSKFLTTLCERLRTIKLLRGNLIAFDYHNIVAYTEKPEIKKSLRNEWIPSEQRARTAKKSLLAQDLETTTAFYAKTKLIKNEEHSREILKVVEFCQRIFGAKTKRYVFDCRVTNYDTLRKINRMGEIFITLAHRRTDNDIHWVNVQRDEDFKDIIIDNPYRKYKHVKIIEREIYPSAYKGTLRQIIMKNHGRKEPTFFITNDVWSPPETIITEYTYRTRIENKLQELVGFFHVNALPSYFWDKTDASLAFSLLAAALYQLFQNEIEGYKNAKAETIFRYFIMKNATITIEPDKIVVKFDYFPEQRLIESMFENINQILGKFGIDPKVQWLGNRVIEYSFEEL